MKNKNAILYLILFILVHTLLLFGRHELFAQKNAVGSNYTNFNKQINETLVQYNCQLFLNQNLNFYESSFDNKNNYNPFKNSFLATSDTVLIDSMLYHKWNTTSADWMNYERYIYSHDQDSNNTVCIRYKRDSINSVWTDDHKWKHIYDLFGKEIMTIEYMWDYDLKNWYANYKEVTEYNANGDIMLFYIYKLDTTNNNWFEYVKKIYDYDKKGNIVLYVQTIGYDWGTRMQSTKEETDYDENNNIIRYARYSWDSVAWIGTWKEEFEYNQNSKIHTTFKWGSSGWVGMEKKEYIYNEYKEKIIEFEYYYSSITNIWIKYYRTDYFYDTINKNNLMEYITQRYDSYDSIWIFTGKMEYVYNDDGYLILSVGYGFFDKWVAFEKFEYDYDLNGNDILQAKYVWKWGRPDNEWIIREKTKTVFNSDNKPISQIYTGYWNVWPIIKKYEYDYDDRGNTIYIARYEWDLEAKDIIGIDRKEYAFDSINNHILFLSYLWDTNINDWCDNKKNEMFYSSHNLISVDIFDNGEENIVKIYPSLITEGVNIEYNKYLGQASFQLYDIKGQLIVQRKVSESQFLDFFNLSSGIYIYKILLNNKIHAGKLVKQE